MGSSINPNLNFARHLVGAIVLISLVPFCLYVYLDLTGAIRSWNWLDSSCAILGSEPVPVSGNNNLFALQVKVGFPNAEDSTSVIIPLDIPKTMLTAEITLAALAYYSPGANVRCFINPSVSREIVLGRSPEQEKAVIVLTVLLMPIFLLLAVSRIQASIAGPGSPRKLLLRAVLSVIWSISSVFGVRAYSEYQSGLTASTWAAQTCRVAFRPSDPACGDSRRCKDWFVYSYAIGGKEYRSNRVSPFGIANPPRTEWEQLLKLNVGDPLPCLVDPANPLHASIYPS